MKRLLFIVMILSMISSVSFSQQALWGVVELISPQVNANNTVTFRFKAANAKEVKLSGEWMPPQGWSPGMVDLKKDTGDVWTYTTEVLPSDLYSYYFVVDGLRCTDPNNVYTIRDVVTVNNIFIVGNGKGDLYSVKDVPHGTVSQCWYASPTNNATRRLSIYTPPSYERSKEKFPVLYLLHGMGGDEKAWLELGRTAQILDNLIAQGKAKPMIVVMTNGNVDQNAAPGESSKGFEPPTIQLPNTMNGKMEESFVDVIKFVESTYRVKADKAHRAIAGLSMGGFHSMHISRYYPNTFDYIGLFSAAITPHESVKSKVYENIDQMLKKQMDNKYKLYWIAIGKTDFLYKEVTEYRAKLDKMNMPYIYRESEGGHTWTNWRVYLSEFVPQLFNK